MNKIVNLILSFLFPQKCLGCGKENEIICQECLERVDSPTLIKTKNVFAAADYNDKVIKRAVWLLKYRKIKTAAEPLAELIRARIAKEIKPDSLLIPIPLSPKRLKERGFNQSELIAKRLSDNVATNCLCKIRETDSQVSLKNRKERLNNLNGCFDVQNPELVFGKNIILIDDVSTTGATISEATRVLRGSGAKSVLALVVARG